MPVRKDFKKETNEHRGHTNFKEQHEKGLKCENALSYGAAGSCRRDNVQEHRRSDGWKGSSK